MMIGILKRFTRKLVSLFRWVQKETEARRTRFLLKGAPLRREDDDNSVT